MAWGDAFIGRSDELAAARALLEDDGPGGLVVAGQAGIGKSRLVAELARHAEAAGWTIETVTATRSMAQLSLGAFGHLEPDDLPPAPDPSARLTRVELALRDLGGPRGLLVVVDDAPLLDKASMALVQRLVIQRRARVALTSRTDEPLPDELAILVKDGHARRIDLGPLSRSDADALVADTLRGPVEDDAADAIWASALGNPLFTRELATWARTTGALERRGERPWEMVGDLAISPLLQDQLARHLDALAPETRRALEDLAVAEALELATFERCASLDVIAALETEGLVSTSGGRTPVARLAHPLYGAAVVATAGAARMQAAARRVADVVEQLDSRRPTDVLLAARLRSEGGIASPDLSVAAALISLESHDPAQSLAFAQTAIDAGGGVEAELARARALSDVGRTDEADQAFADIATNTTEIGALTRHHADHLIRSGRTDDAVDLIVERLAMLPLDEQERLRSLQSIALFYAGRPDDAIAIAASSTIDADRTSSHAWSGLVSALVVTGAAQEALDVADRFFAALRTAASGPELMLFDVTNSLFGRLLALWQLGRSSEGDDPFTPVAGVDTIPYMAERVHQRGLRGPQTFFRGHLDAAAEIYDDVGEELWAVALQVGAFNASVHATVEAMRGEADEARRCLAAVDAVPVEARAGFLWWTERARAWILVADGDVAAGVDASRELCEQHAGELFHLTTSLHDLVRLGSPDLAVEALATQAGRPGATWWDRVCAEHADALLALDPDRLVEVARRFEAGGLDLHAAEALAQAARAFTDRDKRVRAVAAWDRCRDVAARCGRARTPALAPHQEILTEREHAVVRLAATGCTNKQIAARLGTSPRTVGNQLQSAYDKLNVHTRAELTDLVRDQPSAPGNS